MGGFFGVVSSGRCAEDLFYGTDYHSHLGNQRGGLLVHDGKNGFTRFIHDIRNSPFRSMDECSVSVMIFGSVLAFWSICPQWEQRRLSGRGLLRGPGPGRRPY